MKTYVDNDETSYSMCILTNSDKILFHTDWIKPFWKFGFLAMSIFRFTFEIENNNQIGTDAINPPVCFFNLIKRRWGWIFEFSFFDYFCFQFQYRNSI